jgi:hypothetical protein
MAAQNYANNPFANIGFFVLGKALKNLETRQSIVDKQLININLAIFLTLNNVDC